ncbi:MAG: hypothetical protein IJR65_05795 [Oscillospiraceae bacterium]|nr:hypothetical protein [Oscillospiraceae bacterium]
MENAKATISFRPSGGNAWETAYQQGYKAGLEAASANTWSGTQAEYDALPSYDPDVYYFILEDPEEPV